MRYTDEIYQKFLEEMRALEAFRLEYAQSRHVPSLEKEDPDVRRLIEALAFFQSRTNLANERNLLLTRKRLFQQFFPYLLSPLPVFGLLKAKVSPALSEPITLLGETLFLGETETKQEAYFHTTEDLSLAPLHLEGVKTEATIGGRVSYQFYFRAPYPLENVPQPLSLLIHYLDSYPASLQIHHYLKKHTRSCTVSWSGEDSPQPVEVTFHRENRGTEPSPWHPITQIQQFFHFPQKELYLHLHIPSPPRPWETFRLTLELEVPNEPLYLQQEVFHLFTTPIVNLVRHYSEPLRSEGLKERYPILHPNRQEGWAFHSLCGVYEIGEKGMKPIPAGILGSDYGYEVERGPKEGLQRRIWLLLKAPHHFFEERVVSVEAWWHQPWLSEVDDLLHLSLYNKFLEGVSWELLGKLTSSWENPIEDDLEGLLQLLTLERKRQLQWEEVLLLLKALGIVRHSLFGEVPSLVQKARCEESRDPSGQGRQVLSIELAKCDDTFVPVVEVFFEKLAQLLQVWNSDWIWEVRVNSAESGLFWRYSSP